VCRRALHGDRGELGGIGFGDHAAVGEGDRRPVGQDQHEATADGLDTGSQADAMEGRSHHVGTRPVRPAYAGVGLAGGHHERRDVERVTQIDVLVERRGIGRCLHRGGTQHSRIADKHRRRQPCSVQAPGGLGGPPVIAVGQHHPHG